MYESYYGLRERPFDLTPNPGFMYMTPSHREALSNIQYGISGRKGITLIAGEAGTGKTTVVRAALASMSRPQSVCVHLNNPMLARGEFYEYLASEFGLSQHAVASKAGFLLELEKFAGDRRRADQTTAVIIDEAQALPFELLEEIRLLANLETNTEKLLPLVLVGQPELAERLEQPELRQLKQRVALRCELRPLTLAETAAYISGRIWIAGGDIRKMFTKEAVEAIFHASRGIPRTVSVLCDNALVTGFASDVRPVGPEIIAEVVRDFRLNPSTQAESRANVSESRGDFRLNGNQDLVGRHFSAGDKPPATLAPGNGHGHAGSDDLVAALRARTTAPPKPTAPAAPPAPADTGDHLFKHFGAPGKRRRRFWFSKP